MPKRFLSIWFCHLKTDWFSLRRPALLHTPFVLALPDHGRMVISAANILAQRQGIATGMVLADARAILPSLQFFDDKREPTGKLLNDIALWCIRYAPVVAVDPPDGLILEVTGCPHLWGGEEAYITVISNRFKSLGYHVRLAMGDTIGAAWAISRFGQNESVVEKGQQKTALLSLPAAALRLEPGVAERLYKLGLCTVKSFISMPRTALRRRFGPVFLQRLDQALGHEEETIIPVISPEPFQERLPCLEPIITATGIEIALHRLLEAICLRLQQEEKGLRMACFKCYRVDGKIEEIDIGTNRASHNVRHLFKLFEWKLPAIEPALGIELFILEAPEVEDLAARQENLWEGVCGMEHPGFSELMDRIAGKIGVSNIHRYLPDEHYWPERSFRVASSLHEQLSTTWNSHKPRPIQLLSRPEPIEVTAPIPDYPPMLFRYKGKLHTIKKADGPERIEPEWWLQEGMHRDYYNVEDEEGYRYWLFRLGHYTGDNRNQWFLHGFFA